MPNTTFGRYPGKWRGSFAWIAFSTEAGEVFSTAAKAVTQEPISVDKGDCCDNRNDHNNTKTFRDVNFRS